MIIDLADEGDGAGGGAHFGADHVAEGAAVAAGRRPQHDEVLHGAGENNAGQQPKRARQIAHLGRQYGTDERTGTGDGGEVVAEQDRAVGRRVIEAVIVANGRRGRLASSFKARLAMKDGSSGKR